MNSSQKRFSQVMPLKLNHGEICVVFEWKSKKKEKNNMRNFLVFEWKVSEKKQCETPWINFVSHNQTYIWS